MAVTAEYFRMQREYETKFGPQTVVVIQVGSFYEIYEYDPKKIRVQPLMILTSDTLEI